MIMKDSLVFVFDLDDTLYKEIDFLKSAYVEISEYLQPYTNVVAHTIYNVLITTYNNGGNPFKAVLEAFHLCETVKITTLLDIYRNHKPNITLAPSAKVLLEYLKVNAFKIGLITDGRSQQQRSKLEALGLYTYFDDLIISEEFGSEKPHINNFKFYEDKYGKACKYVYIGDNTKKDFVTPNQLGWTSICLLDNTLNIHKQSFDLADNYLPLFKINDLKEVPNILNQI